MPRGTERSGNMYGMVLCTGVFDKGGISRYTRYEIRALREILGSENVCVYSLLGPDGRGFENRFQVDYVAGGLSLVHKIKFSLSAIASTRHKALVICNHVHLGPVGFAATRLFAVPYWINTFGLEVWSGLSALERFSLRHASHVVSDCNFTRRYLQDHMAVNEGKISVLYDCADTDRFHQKPVGNGLLKRHGIPGERRKLVLSVGRLDYVARHKGYHRIMQALRGIEAVVDWHYVIVGQGDYRQTLEQVAHKLGIHNRVTFVGGISDSDLVDFYNRCDVFILVSEFGKNMGEGLPLVHLEAAACGKPVIAGNADGSAEVVEDGVTGFSVDPLRIEDIRDSLRKILSNPSLANEMGEAGRNRVIKNFSYQVFKETLRKTLHVYASNP